MNYANMIEEKNLKKTFIIATLVSTIINCFGSAHGLYDRLQQKKTDNKQDAEIKKLQEEIKKRDEDGKGQNNGRRSPDRDNLEMSLQRSGAAIQSAYNADYDRMGRRFAVGDIIAQNELQAQIIQLQQTVISILEEAVYTGRQPSRADMVTLFKASEAAREGSIQALNGQYQRLIDRAPRRASLPPAMAPSIQDAQSALVRVSSVKSNRPKSISERTLGPASAVGDVTPLYCRYSFALQDDPNRPLSSSFAPGGNSKCDACGTMIPIDPGRAWQVFKEDPTARGDRRYHILNRFMVKCHRANGEFACVLCTRFRKIDTIWEDLRSFAKHVSRAHDVQELNKEIDIQQVN